jgi:hypothetical protein
VARALDFSTVDVDGVDVDRVDVDSNHGDVKQGCGDLNQERKR